MGEGCQQLHWMLPPVFSLEDEEQHQLANAEEIRIVAPGAAGPEMLQTLCLTAR